jgi:hypothetical protein
MEENKQRFSDIIGGLVSSVAYARSIADQEAIRIAYLHRQDELLKSLPIPRLRIQRVSISLPLIVTDVIHGTAAVKKPATELAALTTEKLKQNIIETKQYFLDLKNNDKKIVLTAEEKNVNERFEKIIDAAETDNMAYSRFESKLKSEIELAYMELYLAEGDSPSDASIRDKIGVAVQNVIRNIFTEYISKYVFEIALKNKANYDFERANKTINELMDHNGMNLLIKKVCHSAQFQVIQKPTISPDFYVTVNTDEIKNSGGGNNVVTRLNMILREEGLEWHTEEKDGIETSMLTTE